MGLYRKNYRICLGRHHLRKKGGLGLVNQKEIKMIHYFWGTWGRSNRGGFFRFARVLFGELLDMGNNPIQKLKRYYANLA